MVLPITSYLNIQAVLEERPDFAQNQPKTNHEVLNLYSQFSKNSQQFKNLINQINKKYNINS